ncbi:hypothetical protein ETB97_003203 [Aspergillus alliaceus]|uniref:Uncharacterized protein n=1 Tax=Petromyces alliaceus TaxID=209559 RepID=A0A8H6A3G5_PETAA|nr:hypothetical protein ETB97_003203 [Aspergillus burnettii]
MAVQILPLSRLDLLCEALKSETSNDPADESYKDSNWKTSSLGIYKISGPPTDASKKWDNLNLPAIYESTRNSIVAAFWTVLEIFQDPILLAKVREEVKNCANDNAKTVVFDIDKLLQSTLLQSIYAEILRLRVHIFIVRAPTKYHLQIRDWFIPTAKALLMSSTPAHMDTNVWNTGPNDEHPLSSF